MVPIFFAFVLFVVLLAFLLKVLQRKELLVKKEELENARVDTRIHNIQKEIEEEKAKTKTGQ